MCLYYTYKYVCNQFFAVLSTYILVCMFITIELYILIPVIYFTTNSLAKRFNTVHINVCA